MTTGASTDVLFHVTKKVQDLLRLGPADLVPAPANDPPPLSAWYVNVLTLDRRKVLHVTEATTFFTFMIAGVRKADLVEFGPTLRMYLAEVMRAGGFTEDEVVATTGSIEPDRFAKTASRQVLGVMNEQAFAFEAFVDDHGGLAGTDIVAAGVWLNTMIVTPLVPKFYYPRDAMRAALTVRLGSAAPQIPHH